MTKKIAVIGGNGFVGSNLVSHMAKNNEVVSVTRSTIDLLDFDQVENFLKEHQFDVVINAAAVMTDADAIADTRNNLGIFMNFHQNRQYFKKFINLASGAEYDRTTNIEDAKEETIFNCLPKDSYGFGQNIKSRIAAETPGFYNLRIFNCFGKGEIKTRIFPKLLTDTLDGFAISNDRYFDYFCIQDLCTVVEHFVNNTELVYDINCVYKNKYKISEVAKMFLTLHKIDKEIIIESASDNNYTGSGTKLAALELPLLGLVQGLKNYE